MELFKLLLYKSDDYFFEKIHLEYFFTDKEAESRMAEFASSSSDKLKWLKETIELKQVYGLNSVGRFTINLFLKNNYNFSLLEKVDKYNKKSLQNEANEFLLPINCAYLTPQKDYQIQLYLKLQSKEMYQRGQLLSYYTQGTYLYKYQNSLNDEMLNKLKNYERSNKLRKIFEEEI